MGNEPVSVSAILLAAGESKRIGRQKLLLNLGDKTILEHSIDNLLGSKVSEVIVVLGYGAKETMPALASRPVKVMENHLYRQGMSTSIIAGLCLTDSRASALMLYLADQPLIQPVIIDRLIEAFESGGKGIVVPVHMNKRGHPVIFSIRYKEELMKLKGDVGGREIIRSHPEDVLEVDVGSDSIFDDIDTYEDYQHIKESMGKAE